MPATREPVVHFGLFEVALQSRELRKSGRRIALQEQPFRVLARLLQRAGEVVTREELRADLWPADTFVDFDQGLNGAIKRLRSALSDSAGTPRFVETCPRRGYRFVAPITCEADWDRDRQCDQLIGAPDRGQAIGGPAFDRPQHASATPAASARRLERLNPVASSGPSSPLVGRAREMSILSSSLARTVMGMGTTVLITGDAGMGKTALVDAFVHSYDTVQTNALVCLGQSVEHSGAAEAYMPILDALEPMVARPDGALHQIIDAHAPSWRAQFPGVYPREDLPSAPPTPARLARELGDALSAAALCRPVILILEDVHWADPSTAELVRYLACRTRRVGLLLVLTCRMDEIGTSAAAFSDVLANLEGREGCTTVDLAALDENGIRAYLEQGFSLHAISAPLASLLSATTEGHPLFLVSLVQLLIQIGDLQQENGQWRLTRPPHQLHIGVPRTVQAVVRRKLNSLDEEDRRALHYASIAGLEFSTEVLAPIVGTEGRTLEERLNAIEKASRLVTLVGSEYFPEGTWGTRYKFVHAVYQNVIYHDLPVGVRAAVHRQLAERLTALHGTRTAGIAAQLARHFMEGQEPQRAFEHFLEAGDSCMTVSAGREAADQYSQAIALAEGNHVIPDVRIAWAHYKRAIAWMFLSDVDSALADYREALSAARRADEQDLMFDIDLGTAYAHFLAERMDETAEAALAVRQRAECSAHDSKRLRYLVLDIQLKTGRGELSEAISVADRAVELARSLSDSERLWFSMSLRAQLAHYQADYGTALPYLREVCTSAPPALRRVADPRPLSVYFHGALFLGLTLGDLGYISDGLATLHSALDAALRDGYKYWVPQLLTGIAQLYSDAGAAHVAVDYHRRATSEAPEESRELRAYCLVPLASDYVHLGQLDLAGALLSELEALTKRDFFHAWQWRTRFDLVAAEHALARGAPSRALQCGAQASAQSRRLCLWKEVVRAEQVLAVASAAQGNWSQAAGHIDQALAILSEHPIPLIAWKIHATELWIHRRGQRTSATSSFERAQERVLRLSSAIREEPLKAALLESFYQIAGQPC